MKLFSTLIILFSLAVSAQAKDFTFTAIPDQDSTQLEQRFGAVSEYLGKALGIEVRYVPVKSYAAAVTAFRNDQVQLAWFGGLSGVQARLLVPGSQAIAQGDEDRFFKTYFIAHHSTGLKKSDEFPKGIANKTLTFGSKGSTSGRLMPEFYIRQHLNDAPDALFKRIGFSGNHSRTAALVNSGAYEIGVLSYKVWEKELAAGKIDPKKVQVIWETPQYQDYQWSIRGDVDAHWGEGFGGKIKQALLNMKDPDLLARFPRKAFIEAKNEDYQAILDTAKSIGLID
ncbi:MULTISPECIES: putative selenate ABC transporter substrate-binding protein [unclassified Oleiphilus]|jgi:phosphonate transport system substrate-binding protein|uniref:putative selenate ABC transporter substrate-binding protein n=2 Tax=Oleiphilus TaxID=141450 RepID=UPI0007C27D0F|nr:MULTISPECIES: putative selenate ABC transporter substrate-binding protein [unclassified Oleiphilus]KZY47341.1 phosphonate ABC transporter substrate-binding protein [Oleiphilus sp. HI0050]KZY76015.1 phosphonate ABC transporter substrate-binding protein [Oleiphilus sp. HI0069]KZY77235.1 phosphonate ABC transporter substrate-binding protein [Oleiphilus sp. HI0068]KZY96185.1 phosphonate ABC transporter substrate-binding protein [Oleiphilus sp. HI0072]KZZ07406.1 phosphonate ABC transporter subst